jgi:hypothetical protein
VFFFEKKLNNNKKWLIKWKKEECFEVDIFLYKSENKGSGRKSGMRIPSIFLKYEILKLFNSNCGLHLMVLDWNMATGIKNIFPGFSSQNKTLSSSSILIFPPKTKPFFLTPASSSSRQPLLKKKGDSLRSL